MIPSLLEQPRSEVRKQLATGAPVYLAFNPVEYHGPHLSLHNDSLLTQGFVRQLHRRLLEENPDWPLLFAGELEVGVDPVPGPGSRPVPYSAALAVALQACGSLADLGADKVVLATFHGSPLHNMVLTRCTEYLEGRGIKTYMPAATVFRNFLDPDVELFGPAFAHIEDPAEREDMASRIRHDFHGGFLETSLALHFAPASVGDYASVPPCPMPAAPGSGFMRLSRLARRLGKKQLAQEFQFVAEASPWYRLRPFPGYTGRPHRASAQAGSIVADILVEQAAAAANAVFAGECLSPRPMMMWVPRLTLYGRIGPKNIPADALME